MIDDNNHKQDSFQKTVDDKARRKQRHQRESSKIWFSLGTFGMVGWSIAIPMIAGIFFGIWLDKNFAGDMSWTLTLLVGGVFLGCANAWYWIEKERKHTQEERSHYEHD